MNVKDLAEYLQMQPITIYKHLLEGRIPGFKVGSHWRFRRSTIEKWIESKENTPLSAEDLQGGI